MSSPACEVLSASRAVELPVRESEKGVKRSIQENTSTEEGSRKPIKRGKRTGLLATQGPLVVM